jgi:hypothetical protein
MIEDIESKINRLTAVRNSNYVKSNSNLESWLCDTIAHCYSLESCILLSNKLNSFSKNFFEANVSVNRFYREWGLDEVADIYNDLRKIAINFF